MKDKYFECVVEASKTIGFGNAAKAAIESPSHDYEDHFHAETKAMSTCFAINKIILLIDKGRFNDAATHGWRLSRSGKVPSSFEKELKPLLDTVAAPRIKRSGRKGRPTWDS